MISLFLFFTLFSLSTMTFSPSLIYTYIFSVPLCLCLVLFDDSPPLCPLSIQLLVLFFVFGRERLYSCQVLAETDCVPLVCCRITSSTWASWGCSEQLASLSCWDKERPSASSCGPSFSPLRYSVTYSYSYARWHMLHSSEYFVSLYSVRLCRMCVCSLQCCSSSMPLSACRWVCPLLAPQNLLGFFWFMPNMSNRTHIEILLTSFSQSKIYLLWCKLYFIKNEELYSSYYAFQPSYQVHICR